MTKRWPNGTKHKIVRVRFRSGLILFCDMQEREKAVNSKHLAFSHSKLKPHFYLLVPQLSAISCMHSESFLLRTGQATFTADTLCQEIKTWVWIPIFCILLLFQRPENFLDSILWPGKINNTWPMMIYLWRFNSQSWFLGKKNSTAMKNLWYH